MQLYSFIGGILWAGIAYPYQIASLKKEQKNNSNKLNSLFKFQKELIFTAIEKDIKKYNKNFRTRIFVPENGLQGFWNRYIRKNIIFQYKNIDGVTDSIKANTLRFLVYPKIEGLVGRTYNEKSIMIDCNVNSEEYNLTPYQKSKTSDVKFCTTIPLFDTNDNIKAILAIDSNKEVTLSDKEISVLENHLIEYAAFIDKHINI